MVKMRVGQHDSTNPGSKRLQRLDDLAGVPARINDDNLTRLVVADNIAIYAQRTHLHQLKNHLPSTSHYNVGRYCRLARARRALYLPLWARFSRKTLLFQIPFLLSTSKLVIIRAQFTGRFG